jgi:hypothetical protein
MDVNVDIPFYLALVMIGLIRYKLKKNFRTKIIS